MRIAALALALLAAPTVRAQVTPPEPTPPAHRSQSVAMAGVGGGLAGFAAGGMGGYAVGDAVNPKGLVFSEGGVYGFLGGSSIGATLGVLGGRRLAGDRRGSLAGAFGGAVLGQALAWGATYVANEVGGGGARDVVALSVPVATVVGATLGVDL